MRCLALARYRFLTIIRRLRWVFPVIVMAIVFPGFLATESLLTTTGFRNDITRVLSGSAFALLICYVIQLVALTMLCWSFGVVAPRSESERPSDLMDLVPLRGQTRFWGDALGIYAATMALHLCTTPMLAVAVIATPFPSAIFWWFELVFATLLFLVSASASLTLRHEPKSWTDLSGRRGAVLLLCYVMIIVGTTKVEEFPDALATLFSQPSALAWHALVASIANVPLFIALSVAFYAGFIGWFSLQASRIIERA